MAEAQEKELSAQEKAAVFFLCMDEKTAGDVMGHLKDDEILSVGSAMLGLQKILTGHIESVFEKFNHDFGGKDVETVDMSHGLRVNGAKTVKKLFSKTLSPQREQTILSSMPDSSEQNAEESKALLIHAVNHTSPDTLFGFLKNENPQMVALVLVHAKKKLAKEILDKFPEEQQGDLVGRMARINEIPLSILDGLRDFLSSKSSGGPGGMTEKKEVKDSSLIKANFDGVMDAIKILKGLPLDKAMKIIEDIQKTDAEMGASLTKQFFTIEDLIRADEAGIKELLKAVRNEDLKVALKNVDVAVQEKFFKCMSQRAAMILKEDMEVMAPLKVEEVDAAQEIVLNAAKNLMKEDKMKLTLVSGEGE